VNSARANRFVLLTPAGAGAIAVIRITGDAVGEFLQRHFSKSAKSMRCVHGELRDRDGEVLDDIVLLLHENGGIADLNLHGGPWVIESVQNLLRAAGFEAGDTTDAFADVPNMIEREMLSALPLAKTEAGIRMLLAQPEQWRSGASIDVNDQTLWRLLHPARVAIVGVPNVGKSTLANQLFGQQRSITADLPGTTRDWVGELADVDGLPIVLMDTPGLRISDDSIEQAAIGLSRRVIESADLVVVVMDPTQEIEPQLQLAYSNQITVLNKIDRMVEPLGLQIDVETIATSGQGIEKLRALVRQRLGVVDLDPNRPRWWTQRQRDSVAGSR
jgi:small GTP-binding protein